MDVNDYLRANIHSFNVELLEMVFDVQNMGDLLDSKDTNDFLQNIEKYFKFSRSVVGRSKEDKKEMRNVCFIKLTENSSGAEGRTLSVGTWPFTYPKNGAKSCKSKQKSKSTRRSKRRS